MGSVKMHKQYTDATSYGMRLLLFNVLLSKRQNYVSLIKLMHSYAGEESRAAGESVLPSITNYSNINQQIGLLKIYFH